MVKVPLLFYLTLLVTLPSLYVFNALVGSRLDAGHGRSTAGGVVGGHGHGTGFAGPDRRVLLGEHHSYPFMSCSTSSSLRYAGSLGLLFLLQTLHRLSVLDSQPPAVTEVETAGSGEPAECARSAREPCIEQTCQDGVPALGHRLRSGRSADGLGLAPVRWQPGSTVRRGSAGASRISSRPSSGSSSACFPDPRTRVRRHELLGRPLSARG